MAYNPADENPPRKGFYSTSRFWGIRPRYTRQDQVRRWSRSTSRGEKYRYLLQPKTYAALMDLEAGRNPRKRFKSSKCKKNGWWVVWAALLKRGFVDLDGTLTDDGRRALDLRYIKK